MAARERLKKRVGRSVVKKPETLNIEEVVLEEESVEALDDGMAVNPTQESAVKLSRQQENEWDKIKVRWTEQTRIQVMTEFIRDKGLFLELAKYAKKRIR